MPQYAHALLLIDHHKPGAYSTLHLVDDTWWAWLQQPSPAALRTQSSTLVPLPAGRVDEEGEHATHVTSGSFHNDLMHVVANASVGTESVKLTDLSADCSPERVSDRARVACLARGIMPAALLEGIWY